MMYMILPNSSFVLRRPTSVVLSTPSPRRQTSLVFRHTMYCRCTSVLSIPNPRSRTSPRRRCVFPFMNSRFPLTSKIKFPTIRVMSRSQCSGEVLSSHDVVNWISTSDTVVRLFTKDHRDIHLLFFQFVSQHIVRFFPIRNQKQLYQAFWHTEVHVRRLRIKIVGQRVVCVHSVGLRSFLLLRVFLFTDSRGSTSYISFWMYPLPKWNMMDVHVWVSPVFVFIIVLVWLLLHPALTIFNLDENKLSIKLKTTTKKKIVLRHNYMSILFNSHFIYS